MDIKDYLKILLGLIILALLFNPPVEKLAEKIGHKLAALIQGNKPKGGGL